MSTTTTTDVNFELRQRVWASVTRKGGLDEQGVEILLFGIQHSLTRMEAVESAENLWSLAWGHSWRERKYTSGPLELAWEDQKE